MLIETKTYQDGTVATGVAPLPETSPSQLVDLPPPPELSDDERRWLHYNPNTSDIEQWVYGYAITYARAALAARKPLTRKQINEASRDAQVSFCLKVGGTYEEELARAVERAHGINGPEVK